MQKKEVVQWSKLCNMLKDCTKTKDLQAGRRIHLSLIRRRLDREGLLGDHLIRFYSMCGRLQAAHSVFCDVQGRSVYTWNAIMSAHLKLGSSVFVLHLYVRMISEGVTPDKVSFLCITKACTNLGALNEGRLAHAHMLYHGLYVDEALSSALVAFYAFLRCLCDARRVFNDAPTKDQVLWGAIISGYAQHFDTTALELFDAMLIRGLTPSHFIINSLLKVCPSLRDLHRLHEQVIKNGLESDLIIGSSLVGSYSKFGDFDVALTVFRMLPKRDVILWGTLIDGCIGHGHCITGIDLFCQMQQENIFPDGPIFLSILEGCAQIADLKHGRVLHHRIIKSGLHMDVRIESSLVNFYAVCGSLHEGRKVFDMILHRDVVAWGAIIAGYIQHGNFQTVIKLFEEMQEENIEPDEVILLSMLRAYGGLGVLRKGWEFHDHFVRRDLECSTDAGTVLVSMYVGCGSLEEARRVFDMLPKRDKVTWCAMISGYVNEGDSLAVFELLDKLSIDNLKPDDVMFLCALKACTIAGAARKGMLVHDQVIRGGLDKEVIISNMLVHMYAGCKYPEEGRRVLEKMPEKDVVSWSALIAGLASVGMCKQAEELLVDMQQQGLKPDAVMCTIILSSYTHNGLLEEGLRFYGRMRPMEPTVVHFTGLVDLFSRTGQLHEAKELSQAMPFLPDMIGRTALLTSSRTFGEADLGRHCFDQVLGQGFLQEASTTLLVSTDEDADTNDMIRASELDISNHEGKDCFENTSAVLQFLPEGRRCMFIDYRDQREKHINICTAQQLHQGMFALPAFG